MKLRHLSILIIFLHCSLYLSAQTLTNDKLLKLEPHPTDNSRFIAKFYNKQTGGLTEYWTMATTVPEIDVSTFEQYVKEEKIFADGPHYVFYNGVKKKFEVNYKDGVRTGKAKAYYPSGELKYEVAFEVLPVAECTHYYKNGNISKTENYKYGKPEGKAEAFYPDGKKYAVYTFRNGKKEGKYTSFYPNGKPKRKARFENGQQVSARCFAPDGKEKECTPFTKQPLIDGGVIDWRKYIDDLNLDFNIENKDTAELRIVFSIDTLGKTEFQFCTFHQNRDFIAEVHKWVDQLPAITPGSIDDRYYPCLINLSFPVYSNQALLADTLYVNYRYRAPDVNEINEPTWFFDFPNPADDKIYFVVDEMPSFPGGEKERSKFFARNMKIPEEAMRQNITGTTYLNFVVEKDGTITAPRIAKSLHPSIDNEALRLVGLMPKWNPGIHHGRPVKVSYTMPFEFKLVVEVKRYEIREVVR